MTKEELLRWALIRSGHTPGCRYSIMDLVCTCGFYAILGAAHPNSNVDDEYRNNIVAVIQAQEAYAQRDSIPQRERVDVDPDPAWYDEMGG